MSIVGNILPMSPISIGLSEKQCKAVDFNGYLTHERLKDVVVEILEIGSLKIPPIGPVIPLSTP